MKSAYSINSLTEMESDSLPKMEVLVVEDALLQKNQFSMLYHIALSIRTKENVVMSKNSTAKP